MLLNRYIFIKFILIVLHISSISTKTIHNTSCSTPSHQKGKCVSMRECPPYESVSKKITRKNIEYFRQLQCGYVDDDPQICCPFEGVYNITKIVSSNNKKIRRKRNAIDKGIKYEHSGRLLKYPRSDLLPGKDVCGIQVDDDRIFSGEITGIDEFPWMALLFYRTKFQTHNFACGGALISDRYVMTAAHCVTGEAYDRLGGLEAVRLGEYNVETEQDCIMEEDWDDCSEDPVNITPEEIIPHPWYDHSSKNQHHDIALIRLSTTVKFSDFIVPICLPDIEEFSQYNPDVGSKLYVAGWGRNEFGMKSPVKLKLSVPVVDRQNCSKVYRRYSIEVLDCQICAGGEKGKDSCKGDSGGPLMGTDPIYGNWISTGIVSIGSSSCGQAGFPGIYTDVKSYISWIHDTLRP